MVRWGPKDRRDWEQTCMYHRDHFWAMHSTHKWSVSCVRSARGSRERQRERWDDVLRVLDKPQHDDGCGKVSLGPISVRMTLVGTQGTI